VLGLGWPMRGRGGEKGPRGRERGEWAGLREGLGRFVSFFFSFFFSILNIQTKLFEFKPINSTQIKQCCSMNAQTI
jgi:hypothetical protein